MFTGFGIRPIGTLMIGFWMNDIWNMRYILPEIKHPVWQLLLHNIMIITGKLRPDMQMQIVHQQSTPKWNILCDRKYSKWILSFGLKLLSVTPIVTRYFAINSTQFNTEMNKFFELVTICSRSFGTLCCWFLNGKFSFVQNEWKSQKNWNKK